MEAGCVVAAVIENAASGPQGEPGSSDVLEGDALPVTDQNKDDQVPQAANNDPPEEDQQQGPSTSMVRTDDIAEPPAEPPAEPLLRSCVSTASMKVKNVKKLTFPKGHFPRLAECAHFHYETVDFGNVQLAFADGPSDGLKPSLDSKELLFLVQVTCQGRHWLVKRSYEDFRVLDKHLHLCIYDRRYSQLTELPRHDTLSEPAESVTKMLATYLSRFSAIADNKINCGPVLTWMEIDNKGNHLLVSEEASINVPAIAAAHVTKRYTAQATDELTFEVGDIVSVIDMPPKEDTGWWRGKHGFQVGFFPCDCVELINDKIPPSVQSSVPKPVCKKHGKLVTFLRTFMKSRPPPQKLRQRGILRERVFGCDLGEHLHNSEHDVPQVVKSCAEFIEKHGVVDGIYRLSGISSNIQKLRHEFDSEQVPDLSRDVFRQDIHSVGSLCKLYFRELPNPLLTYQLYDRFSEAVSAATDEERLVKIHNVIQQLPPPHYRTLEYLMRHLSHLATFSSVTNMHTKNLAIVWAPNLLRSRQIESACFSGTAAFMEVRIQSVVVEFILNNTEALFSPKLSAIIRDGAGNNTLSRPKSLLVCSPSTKLLSLEEAQARTQAQLNSPVSPPCLSHSDYIEVGEGPAALEGKFHTVIELPLDSGKRAPAKAKKSPVGNWFSFFHLGKSHSVTKRKLKRHPSEPNQIKSITLPGGRGDSGTLRSTKSEESLTSLHNVEGEPPSYRHLRPRSTSEAVSPASREDLHLATDHRPRHNGVEHVYATASVSPASPEDDLDLSPPVVGISTLDFDPMSFQCSPSSQTPGLQHRDGKFKKNAGWSGWSESDPASSSNYINYSPDISPVHNKGGRRVTSKPLSPKLRKKSLKTQDSQTASSSPLLEKSEESRSPFKHCSQSSGSQSAQNLPDPGTDRLMSSVSVLPPHPPLMSAARKLALALAESAQKAASINSSAPPQRPARPSCLDLRVHPQECYGSHVYAEGRFSPTRFLPAHVADGQESNFTPNVSPLGSGSFDGSGGDMMEHNREKMLFPQAEPTYQSVGVSTPTQPATSPIYANTNSINAFNFRAILAETSMPASIDEVLPRPLQLSSRRFSPEEDLALVESIYSNHFHRRHHWMPLERRPPPDAPPHHMPKGLHRQFSEGCSSGLRYPLSPQYRRYQREEARQGAWCEDRTAGHPSIRRARSFHAPQISHYELEESDLLSPDTLFYVEHPSSQDVSYQRLVQTGLQPLRQQLENVQQYMKEPRYCVEPLPQRSGRQSFTKRSSRENRQPDFYKHSPQRVNREMQNRGAGFYDSPDAFERPVYQQKKPESKGVRPAPSPYESPGSSGSRGREIMHVRSKSDPGNACLLSADRTHNQNARPEMARHQTRRTHCSTQQPPLRKIPSLPERCRNAELDRLMMESFSGAMRPGAMRRPARSQSTRENPHYYRYHAKSSLDPEPTQSNRRTQSTKVRPTHYDHMSGYYMAKPARASNAAGGFSPNQGCVSPHGHRLLSSALGQDAFYRSALKSEVYD
ncbi:uncharacterized protein arhgap32a isoform 1-T1 [Synchiropus picturatus]